MTKMRIRAKLIQATLMASLMLAAITGAVAAGAIEDGGAAYQRHDYETALQLLRTPAEQGNVEAQLLLGCTTMAKVYRRTMPKRLDGFARPPSRETSLRRLRLGACTSTV
jgi:hypothetical protein